MMTSVIIFISNMIFWSFLLPMVEATDEGYDVFHIPLLLKGSHGQKSGRHHHIYHWQQPTKKFSKNLSNDGFGMKLIHSDDRDLPHIQVREGRARSRLRRDKNRVQKLNERLTLLLSNATGTIRQPLRSPIVSGLDEGSGEYFTKLSFGSPYIDLSVTIDTGSDLLWIQCHPCNNCYDQVGPIFNPAKSETYDPIPCYSKACESLPHNRCEGASCQYDMNYGDGSFTIGEFAKETLTMNNTKDKSFVIHDIYFGCGHDNEGLFVASAGILGLGRGDLSFPSQISKILPHKFSYCLTDRFVANDNNARSSYIYFGEMETGHMLYMPMLRNPAAPTFYYVQLMSISVANKLLEVPTSMFKMDSIGRGGVILDSGTSVTRLPTMVYQIMRDEFKSKVKNLKLVNVAGQDLFDTCFLITHDELVPTITLHFTGDVEMVLPADNILIPVDDSGTTFCLAFSSSDGKSNLSIIGNVQQQGFRIEYDLSVKSRIGITREDCSFP